MEEKDFESQYVKTENDNRGFLRHLIFVAISVILAGITMFVINL